MNPFDPQSDEERSIADEERIIAVIRRARQLVAHGWCQNRMAQTYRPPSTVPRDINPLAPDATHFCVYAALQRAAFEIAGRLEWPLPFQQAVALVAAALGTSPVLLPVYNDGRDRVQSDILKLLDRAAGGK